jgi:hypothetical protein
MAYSKIQGFAQLLKQWLIICDAASRSKIWAMDKTEKLQSQFSKAGKR